MNYKIVAIFLVSMFCLIGAVSAADDVSIDVLADVDDVAVVDAACDDVDDSSESIVVEDEPVVVDSAAGSVVEEDVAIEDGSDLEDSADEEVLGQSVTNSPQIAYNDDNEYDEIITTSVPTVPLSIEESTVNSKNEVLGASFEELISESEVIYISQEDITNSKSALNNAINNANENTTIIIRPDTTITRASASNAHKNITIVGENRETVLVTSHTIRSGVAVNYNNTLTWVNVTFSCSIELSNTNYKFINCTFVNSPLQFDGARASLTDPDVYNYEFENCEFVNYTQNYVVVANKFANVTILNCTFDNVTADAIVSTNANRTDDSGRQAGVTIKDSTYKDVTVKGIVKAQNYSVAAVTTDNKYDFATQKTLVSDDAVYMDVPVNATTLTVNVADIKEGEDFTIDVTLSNNITANVSVVINQKEYNVSVVNGNGSLKVTDKLTANTYNVEASYAGEYPYAASTASTTFKVEIIPTSLSVNVADIKEGEDFTIDVTLSNNITANVSVVINQKEYNVSVVNGNGSLKVTDKLTANTYNVEANFKGLSPYAASTNTTTFKVEKVIVNTTLTAPKVSATYNVAKNLVITLKDANGKVLVGKYVTVKVGTISKNIQTDKNGHVSVNVASLVPKSYTAIISFAGDEDYNKASTTANVVVAKATPKLTTKKLTTKVKVKTKKVTATLKDNKGKVLKNTKVTLKVKGKTYTAKTNKKGVATFKVTKLNKKGTFKGTVKFAGNKYFKAVSKTVKIVVKK